jgi:hypothetical protein
MARLFKLILFVPMLLSLSSSAFAQTTHRKSTYSEPTKSVFTSSSSDNAGRMAVSGALGFYGGEGFYTANNSQAPTTISGLFGFGGDFDYYLYDDLSIGGLLRYYSTSDSVNGDDRTNTLLTLGGTVRAHIIETSHWSANLATGLGILNGTVKQGSTTYDPGSTFGLYFGTTLLYKFSSQLAFGIENMRMMGLGSNVNGWPLNDFMFKVRFFL